MSQKQKEQIKKIGKTKEWKSSRNGILIFLCVFYPILTSIVYNIFDGGPVNGKTMRGAIFGFILIYFVSKNYVIKKLIHKIENGKDYMMLGLKASFVVYGIWFAFSFCLAFLLQALVR